MNYKNYLFTGLLISAFAVMADVPVGAVKSQSATQKADPVVTMTEQSMEVRSVGGIEEVVVTAQKKRTVTPRYTNCTYRNYCINHRRFRYQECC